MMEPVQVRYVVKNVQAAVEFYTKHLSFQVEMFPAPGFAALSRGNLRLFLNAPGAGGAGKSMPDGTTPEPGGWNRIQIPVDDLQKVHATLKKSGASFRNDIVQGEGGSQVLLEDPSGNPVELFEPKRKDKGARPPEGHATTVTPFFVVDDVAALIDFVQNAFGASVHRVMKSDDGVMRHATVMIGDSMLMISSGTDLYSDRPSTLHLYVKDVDSVYRQALGAGAKSLEEPINQFYGDRRAAVSDEWNNHWWIATHVEDVDEKELQEREREFRRQKAKPPGG
jgi:uncharacterized glyoxalase superfamily protein PhnB/catechol 2,3-dioxygenase-like lactoylglutathione lyase family enzyme